MNCENDMNGRNDIDRDGRYDKKKITIDQKAHRVINKIFVYFCYWHSEASQNSASLRFVNLMSTAKMTNSSFISTLHFFTRFASCFCFFGKMRLWDRWVRYEDDELCVWCVMDVEWYKMCVECMLSVYYALFMNIYVYVLYVW